MNDSQNHHKRKGDRRSGIDRRRINPPRYYGIEKRMDPESRSGKDRRDLQQEWTEYQPRCIR
jgi:hypothetical protein